MREVRCTFCKKYVKKLFEGGRCETCDKEYQDIGAGITKRYGDVLQKLAERQT